MMRFDELFVHEQRIRRTSFVVKLLVLVLAVVCTVTFSVSNPLPQGHNSQVALTWVTFGSQLIISGSTFVGIIVRETTPRLTASHSVLGTCLFLASGICCVTSFAQQPSGPGALLATGILAILTAALQALDVFFAVKLCQLTPAAVSPAHFSSLR